MGITLHVTAGPHKGRQFDFARHDAFLVGRSRRADFHLLLLDPCMSRVHFMVEVNPPQVALMDMGSTNGTLVNGEEIEAGQRVLLDDGDEIEAGDTVLHVRVTPDEPAPEFEPLPLAEPTPLPADLPPTFAEGACRSCDRPLSPATALLCAECEARAREVAQPIAGYRVVRELGRGAMGVVWLALRQPDGRRVALKTIQPAVPGARAQVERFLREADLLRRLDHPHIVAFRDMGESGGHLFFAMDFVAGTDAHRLVKRHGLLSVGRAVPLLCDLLDALAYAHARGMVHRDVKPANLLVAAGPDRERGLLADFGLARYYEASQLSGLTLSGDVGGTLAFMAPEQVLRFREARPPADVYSASATLYNLLTGRYVFDFPPGTHERLKMILEARAVELRSRRPELPARLAALVHRGLAKDPASRPDANAMLRALADFRS